MTEYLSTANLPDEYQQLAKTVRDFAREVVAPVAAEHDAEHSFPYEIVAGMAEMGLFGLPFPEEYGGMGGDYFALCLALEELGKVDQSVAITLEGGVSLGAMPVYRFGTEEQKQQWLPKMASGEVVGAIAMTEPGTGSDLQNIKTKAIREGEEYVVSGSKTFITNGSQADLVLTVVKTNPDDKAAGISLMLVPTATEGFSRGRVLDKIGMKGQDTSELFFDNVRVPATSLLGHTEGQGFVQLMEQLPQERLLVAVSNVAAMELCLAETLRYVRDRSAFGRPIWGFQNTKFKMAEVATEARVARAFVDECIELHLDRELDIPTAAMAKLWCSERAQRVADACLQLHGGYGYMNEYPIARAWADLRVSQIYAGSSEIMKEIISRSL